MAGFNSISRRRFAHLIGAGAAYAVAQRATLLGTSLHTAESTLVSGAVRLNSNENPYGPSAMALKAMTDAFSLAWRYPDEHTDILIDMLTKLNSVNRNQILLGNGSGEILKLCASAFTGPISSDSAREVKLARPTRGASLSFKAGRGKLIVADPTFEAILNHAAVNGAEVVKVPVNGTFAHDLPKMLAAANEGLVYICNPNNPT